MKNEKKLILRWKTNLLNQQMWKKVKILMIQTMVVVLFYDSRERNNIFVQTMFKNED